MPGSSDRGELAAIQAETLDRLSMLIQRLKPLDRQTGLRIRASENRPAVAPTITSGFRRNGAEKVHVW